MAKQSLQVDEDHLSVWRIFLGSMFIVPSCFLSKVYNLTRKWNNICECDSSPGLLMTWTRPTLTLSPVCMNFQGWGKLNKDLGFKGRAGCRAGQGEEGRGPASNSAFFLSLASPHLSSPSPRQEANCRQLDGKETLGHQLPPPYFYFIF